MRHALQIALPAGVIGLGAGIAAYLILTRPPIEARQPVVAAPLVRVATVQPATVTLTVASQGTVEPRSSIRLVSEVAGVVVGTAETLAAGGFFDAGEVLIEIDARDYELALVQAEARVREAEARLLREEAEAAVARGAWADLRRPEQPAPLLLREPQLAEARAAVAAAKASLELARRELEKTRIRAPFAGRVLDEQVDAGQYVSRGTQLARIYAVDAAEIRLPISTREVAYLDLPLAWRSENARSNHPVVVLQTEFGDRVHRWEGRVVRTEGEFDARTRMITVVARVEDPYGRQREGVAPPLAAGMFVTAEIRGRTVQDAVELPRSALREGGLLPVVDGANRLWRRPVKVLRAGRESVLIEAGLRVGDRVCLTPLETMVDGMEVRVSEEADASGARAAPGGGR